jgi:hypothetical protein
VLDPSKLTKMMISQLWDYWSERAKAKLPILILIDARDQDFGLSRSSAKQARQQHLISRIRIQSDSAESDDQAGDDELDVHIGKSTDTADKGEGMSGSPVRPPSSNHPHLSEQTDVPKEGSPAANTSDRATFLLSLSGDTSYNSLLRSVLTMPVSVSHFCFLHLYGSV